MKNMRGFILGCAAAVIASQGHCPASPIQVVLDREYVYRLRDSKDPNEPVLLQRTTLTEPHEQKRFGLWGVGGEPFYENPVPWNIVDGSLHYIGLGEERPRMFIGCLVMMATDKLRPFDTNQSSIYCTSLKVMI